MGIRCSILDAGYWILDTGYTLSSFRSLRENRWKMEDRCAWKRGDEIWAFIFSSIFPRPSSLTPTFQSFYLLSFYAFSFEHSASQLPSFPASQPPCFSFSYALRLMPYALCPVPYAPSPTAASIISNICCSKNPSKMEALLGHTAAQAPHPWHMSGLI